MLFACTRSAAHILNKQVDDIDHCEDAFFCWHVKLFYISEAAILLFMNELTRFPLFLHLQSGKEAAVEQQFVSLLSHIMQVQGFDSTQIDAYVKEASFQYCKVYNRSIISQMNALTGVYQYAAYHNDTHKLDDLTDSLRYAQIPSFKYNIFPYQYFQAEIRKRYKE